MFKVFSRHRRNQSYAIHTNTKLAMQEWVGKIRQLKEEESFEQEVSTHTAIVLVLSETTGVLNGDQQRLVKWSDVMMM